MSKLISTIFVIIVAIFSIVCLLGFLASFITILPYLIVGGIILAVICLIISSFS